MELIDLCNAGINNIAKVGGKNASLGEMINNVHTVNVPNGFVVTTDCYHNFITHNKINIPDLLNNIKQNNTKKISNKIKNIINQGIFPTKTLSDIQNKYNSLCESYENENISVAVRSSSTAEDLQEASFAGQLDSYLNIKGCDNLVIAIKKCFSSLYNERAIIYREKINYNDPISISVCVQKMVRSDIASSGVAFSLDPDSGFDDVVVINGSYGLGELIVQGDIIPDEFIVFKPTLKQNYKSIIDRKLGEKYKKMVYSKKNKVKIKKVTHKLIDKFCITEEQIITLAKWVIDIENYYTKIYKKWTPVDIEWAIDGLTDKLYIVQARPETIHSNNNNENIVDYQVDTMLEPILTGIAVGNNIGTGIVKVMHNLKSAEFNDGDILVTDATNPDWEHLMMKASAIITNKGGRTCHASIIAREMNIPTVVGTTCATVVLKNKQFVTVSCAEGEIGKIYEGIVPFTKKEINIKNLKKTKTNIMLNIASPNDVFKYHNYPVKGVGLVREEFIINNFIGVHPLALLNYENLPKTFQNKVSKLIRGYDSCEEFYINKLVYGLARIASTFYPQDVIVRFSDFKSNEYKNLLGGEYFEPDEENPMIGWRGASRYYSDTFKEAFGLECKAIKKLRDELGLTNIIPMIPFCRTPKECVLVQEIMESHGLIRHKNGLLIYIMCELPSNVILADQFCKYVDGFSIGSNDLTQLTLGLDRDSSLVAHIYDERDESVKMMISQAIKVCKNNNVKIGICGQGPSDYPDFAQFLVEQNIDSISITPNALFHTINAIEQIEKSQ